MVVRFSFGLLWGEVFEGPSRPILKLKLVRDGGSQFGEVVFITENFCQDF